MTSFLFWIVCLLIQKSPSLASEANEISSASSQTSEHSSSNYETTYIPPGAHINEELTLTTSVNDIECSNTEGCVSPRNLFSTSTIPPGINYKVSWRSFTLKRGSTEATQTNTNAIPSSYSQDNLTTSKAQDTTFQPTNDDVGNELDSEVKALNEHFRPRTSTITLTDEFVVPTNASVLEMNNLLFNNSDLPTIPTMAESISETFVATSTQEYTTGTMMNITSTTLSETDVTTTDDLLTSIPILEHGFTAVPIQDESYHSIKSVFNSIYNETTYIPLSFSSSESTVIPTAQKNLVDIFHEIMSTTTSKMTDAQTFSKSGKTIRTVGGSDLNVPSESTGLTTEYLKEFVSSNATLQSDTDEEKFQVTNKPYTDQGHTENLATESMISSESYLSMYSVNTPHTEISEGHGLSRNLSYFIPSSEQPVMKTETEVVTDRLTELDHSKDISITATSPYSDKIASSTILLKKSTLSDMPTVGTSYLDSTSNIPNFSEQIKTFPSVTRDEPTAHDPGTAAPPLTSTVHVVVGMDAKDMRTSTIALLLPEGRMYEEDIFARSTSESLTTENISSESTALTSGAPSTESGTAMLPTTIQQFQPKFMEDTSPTSIEIAETVGYSNPNISTSLSNLDISQLTTELIDEISSKSNSDASTSQSSTHSYTTDKASETITMNPVKSYPSTTIPPINIPASSLSEMEARGGIKSTFSYSSYASSLTTKPLIDSVTTQQRMGRKDLESTTPSTLEQTTPMQPIALSTVVSSIYTQPDSTSTNRTYPPSSTISSGAPTYSEDSSASSFFPISTIKTTKETNEQFSTTSLVASDYSTDFPVPSTIFSIAITEKESTRIESVEDDVKDSSTTSNIPSFSALSTALPPVKFFTQAETRREGKHIPFSTVATRRETVGLSENGIIRVTSTEPPVEKGTKAVYQQMQLDELMPTEKANIIAAAIQFSSKYLGNEEMEVKMVKIHSWLLHVLMKEFQNWTRDPFEKTEDESAIAPFGNISIYYITPTPEINSSGITLTFIVYNVWKNETLQVDFVLGILNYYSKELKESINASAAYFYHGYEADDRYMISTILERYGVAIITIGLAVVLILLLVCVVVFYRKKTRRSVHCLSNSKFKQNAHEAVGIDLNPAIVILQDEKGNKLGNGNKICDDEGWLAPINDVPQAEDSNMPFIQDTKL